MLNIHSFCGGVCRICVWVCGCECMFFLKFHLKVKLKIRALVPGKNAAAYFLRETESLTAAPAAAKAKQIFGFNSIRVLPSSCWRLKSYEGLSKQHFTGHPVHAGLHKPVLLINSYLQLPGTRCHLQEQHPV